MNPNDVPICYDFALLFHEQKEQKKLIKYCSLIGYLLGNHLGSVESRLSFIINPLLYQIFSDVIHQQMSKEELNNRILSLCLCKIQSEHAPLLNQVIAFILLWLSQELVILNSCLVFRKEFCSDSPIFKE